MADFKGLMKISDMNITLNDPKVSWFDANLCAVLGVIRARMSKASTSINIEFSSKVNTIMKKNGFLEHTIPDQYRTTILFQRFVSRDTEGFIKYITTQFKGKAWGKVPHDVMRSLREGLVELFDNASDHAQSELGIFACGQYFNANRELKFTIADGGIGFKDVVSHYLGKNLTSYNAIDWALCESNTTRRGDRPGGIGLKRLREFIKRNKGGLVVVSEDGYWEEYWNREVTTALLPKSLEATAVSVVINTDEIKRMEHTERIQAEDIF